MPVPAKLFRAGFVWGLLFWATLNALSYFVRSDGWGNLLGTRPGCGEAIGFPWLIWVGNAAFAGHYLSYPAMAADVAVGLVMSVLAGAVVRSAGSGNWRAATNHHGVTADTIAADNSPLTQFQFSLRTLLLLAVAEAVLLGLIRSQDDARPVLLGAIYLLGPWAILVVAYRLRRVVPRQRAVAVALVGLLLVPAAAVLGESIDGIRDFTKGLFGLFVCWIPQCVLMMAILLAWTRFSPRIRRKGIDTVDSDTLPSL